MLSVNPVGCTVYESHCSNTSTLLSSFDLNDKRKGHDRSFVTGWTIKRMIPLPLWCPRQYGWSLLAILSLGMADNWKGMKCMSLILPSSYSNRCLTCGSDAKQGPIRWRVDWHPHWHLCHDCGYTTSSCCLYEAQE